MILRHKLAAFAVMLCIYVDAQLPSFRTHPTDTHVIRGDTTTLQCQVTEPTGADLLWYKDGEVISMNSTFVTNNNGRFSVDGDWENGNYALTIAEAGVSDSGQYFCKISSDGDDSATSNIAVLTVFLPDPDWYPLCLMYLSANSETTENSEQGFVEGDSVSIECISRGEPLPELSWEEGGHSVPGLFEKNMNESKATNIFAWTLTEKYDGALFLCTASLPTMSTTPVCSIGPLDVRVHGKTDDGIAMIPAIITGVLAAIAVILFGVVVVLLFKYRQCKICRDRPDFHDPMQVVTMENLQISNIPPVNVDIQENDGVVDCDDDDGDDNNMLIEENSSPDVVMESNLSPKPYVSNECNIDMGNIVKETSKLQTSTIIRNIDTNTEKNTMQDKDAIPVAIVASAKEKLNNSSVSHGAGIEEENVEPQPSTSYREPPPIPPESPEPAVETTIIDEPIYYISKPDPTKGQKGQGGEKEGQKIKKGEKTKGGDR
ncbi:uncharacterized protein LOC144350270 [Saccoglossus kowalevskii]